MMKNILDCECLKIFSTKQLEMEMKKDDSMEGLEKIKNYLEYLSYKTQYSMNSLDNISMNLALIGNLEMQKETVAKMIGEKYTQMGLLKKGIIVKVKL